MSFHSASSWQPIHRMFNALTVILTDSTMLHPNRSAQTILLTFVLSSALHRIPFAFFALDVFCQTMSRKLRSKTRLEKQQVQRTKETIKEFISSKKQKNCVVTKLDCLEQEDFLSLFELMPLKPSNGMRILRSHTAVQPVKTKDLPKQPPISDAGEFNKNRIQKGLKRQQALGKTYVDYPCHHIISTIFQFRCKLRSGKTYRGYFASAKTIHTI